MALRDVFRQGQGKERPDKYYDTMDSAQLKAMREKILWATFSLLPDALDLNEDMGISIQDRRSMDQTRATAIRRFGTGYVLRSSAEIFLVGTHGAPRIKNKGQRNLLLTGDWRERVEDVDSIIVDTLRR